MNERPPSRQIDSWVLAEHNAAEWMQYWGYPDACVTRGGADGGVDVVSQSALAQVKFEAHQVGTPTLQRLVGARRNDVHKQLMFFSGVGYARPAVEYADEMNIALFKYDLLGAMTPVNSHAEAISTTPTLTPSESQQHPLEQDLEGCGDGCARLFWGSAASFGLVVFSWDLWVDLQKGAWPESVGSAVIEVGLVAFLVAVLWIAIRNPDLPTGPGSPSKRDQLPRR